MSNEDANLFTSDTSSGRELPMQSVSIIAAPWKPTDAFYGDVTAPETPPLIKSVEDETHGPWEIERDAQAPRAALEAEVAKLREEISQLLRPTADLCTCHERDGSYVCEHCYAQGLRGHMQK